MTGSKRSGDVKGVVLAGGTGSRLHPLTKVTNKHLLPVGNRPMIYHVVEQIMGCGITEIMVVTGREHMGEVVGLLGSGSELKCDFTYRVQDRAGGISEALGLARTFVGTGRMLVVLGDNIFEKPIEPYYDRFLAQGSGARVLLKEVDNPTRFGVAELKDGRIAAIEEKPKAPKSRLAVTGVYMYDAKAFEYVSELKPSLRGELEITDVNNAYAREGQLHYDVVDGWWTDAGTFESLQLANRLVTERDGMQ